MACARRGRLLLTCVLESSCLCPLPSSKARCSFVQRSPLPGQHQGEYSAASLTSTANLGASHAGQKNSVGPRSQPSLLPSGGAGGNLFLCLLYLLETACILWLLHPPSSRPRCLHRVSQTLTVKPASPTFKGPLSPLGLSC